MGVTYRLNAAAVVINDQGKILACHRSDRVGAWQLPQGGIEPGEAPRDAILRELREEIGTGDVDILAEIEKPIRYDWPKELHRKGHRGQEQYYFLVRLRGEIDLDGAESQEFDKVEWVSKCEFLSRASGFKLGAYTEALDEFARLLPGVIREEEGGGS